MTLERFRAATAEVEPRALRQAMTMALLAEVPHTTQQYARFYGRVIGALARTASPARMTSLADPTTASPRRDGVELPAH